jgi:hypothetical protein
MWLSDVARAEVCQQDGVARLLKLLKDQLDVESEQAGNLRKVACGFLFNLTNTHGKILKLVVVMSINIHYCFCQSCVTV